ncbi:MAG: class I adenylate-forming enzyme family protein [Xanthobacteraceae bacterium]|nr:class I adenylate-forming enzyme family protein [Xanthobacteraceae bacterium]
MAGVEVPSLRAFVANARALAFLWDRGASVRFTDLARETSLGGRLAELSGRSVLLATTNQLSTALALIELDGIARRFVVLPPDVEADRLGAMIAAAEVNAAVIDEGTAAAPALALPVRVTCAGAIAPMKEALPARAATEWLLMTSGTTGAPKLAVHNLAALTAAIVAPSAADGAAVWGTFYDIRRYGGLQIFLRAVLGRASLVLSSAGEPVADHLARLAQYGVTHLSGTPSQWRRALMSPAIRGIAPRYVRLSGEIADQAILDALRAAFPRAVIGHAYASTEAGVAFDVNDGLAGFPAGYVGSVRDGVEMKVVDGSLRIRSPGAASRYAGGVAKLADADGFVDTGDIVELRGDRYYFAGRNGGIINIGGLKVHPEEVEAVINRHPSVRMSLVRRKQSPVTGSIVVAEVVLEPDRQPDGPRQSALKDDILKLCREALPRHKVPAAISFVPALNVAATGKLLRRQG